MKKKKITRRFFLTISAMTAAGLAMDWKRMSALAAKMGSRKGYPTVIIGAGLGGLCCGAYLAKQGIPVTVVERHNIPGGYATSFDRLGGKFTFEVSLHGTCIHNNATARILGDLGVLDKLQVIPLPEVYRLKTPDLEIAVPQRDPDAYIQILTKKFPREADGIRGFVEEMLEIAAEADHLHRKKGKFFKLLFPLQYRRMWKVRSKTLADLLNDHVKDSALQNILASLWGYYGLPPSKLSGFYYAVATGDYLKNGSYYIRERSQDLSYALADVIERHGGKIFYDTPAEKILVENGAVKGVRLSGGKVLPARAVVSNGSAPATFNQLLPIGAVPAEYRKKLESYRPSVSTFLVWLGLNREIKDRTDGSGYFVGTGRHPDADYESMLKGEIEMGPFGVAIYDHFIEGYSRPGTSTLMLIFLCGYEPWRRFESDYRAGQKGAYNREKARWTDILIRRAEASVIPGLSSMIEIAEAATPLTNWRFTGNTEGAIYGFEQSMNNAYMNRIDNRTPVKGLYLAGAWGKPGGGYTGVLRSGEMTFEMMMADWGK
ncbi:MAG: NAD(P)/FAD-dependent oxidoreductase [Deltaproteobacteria bacterium]|nr:NAD(P)/FAD-dependent oxidoreductase [Deltaproteobacteria bacterium]